MPRPSLLPVALVCSLIVLFALWRSSSGPRESTVDDVEPGIDPSLLCDPFAEPGFLHYDEGDPLQARWIPYSPTCEPAPDWISHIRNRDLDQLGFLANRTILILGDSVDRNGIHHMAEMLGLPRYVVPYDDYSQKGVVPPGWDDRGLPWVVEIPWTNTYFTNGFMYGLDDEDNFRQQPDWHAPGKAEDRIDTLFKVHTDQLPHPPSFISLHSGLWDLAFFGRQDRVSRQSTEIPLTHARVEWWQRRFKEVISHVNATYPRVPLWVRKLHRVGPVGPASYDWRHTGTGDERAAQETFSNFFTDVRVHTIREMAEQVVRDVGVPAFDFGEVWEGWQSHQDMVHPQKFPGGPAYVQALLHHIWMEAQGRETWRLAARRPLAPLVAATGKPHRRRDDHEVPAGGDGDGRPRE